MSSEKYKISAKTLIVTVKYLQNKYKIATKQVRKLAIKYKISAKITNSTGNCKIAAKTCTK